MSVADRGETIGAAIRRLAARFRASGSEHPMIDARTLVGHVTGLDLTGLVREADALLPSSSVVSLEALADRRVAAEPVGRLIGRRYFHGLVFEVTAETLEPREDTEVLVEAALARIDRLLACRRSAVVADLGTGTGAILVAVLAARPDVIGVAIDISAGALATARRNAARHGVDGRMAFVQGSYADALAGRRYDLILSNPRIALDGGEDGLEAYRALIPQAHRALSPNGSLLVEIGHTQSAAVSHLMEQSDFTDVLTLPDLGGRDRVVAGIASTVML